MKGELAFPPPLDAGAIVALPDEHVRPLARRYTREALITLVVAMRTPDAPWPVRVDAASKLLDRAWGKPKETIEVLEDPEAKELRSALSGVSAADLADLLRVIRATPANALVTVDAQTATPAPASAETGVVEKP